MTIIYLIIWSFFNLNFWYPNSMAVLSIWVTWHIGQISVAFKNRQRDVWWDTVSTYFPLSTALTVINFLSSWMRSNEKERSNRQGRRSRNQSSRSYNCTINSPRIPSTFVSQAANLITWRYFWLGVSRLFCGPLRETKQWYCYQNVWGDGLQCIPNRQRLLWQLGP